MLFLFGNVNERLLDAGEIGRKSSEQNKIVPFTRRCNADLTKDVIIIKEFIWKVSFVVNECK